MTEKINQAIRLLRAIKADEIELCFSGGKDSSVILELTKMADIPYRAIYKKTNIDPPGTIAFCRENGAEIVEPKYTFFQLIEQHGFPTRRCRFCCDYLKEYKMLDNAIQGIRRCESQNRAKRYKEPVICRMYGNKDSRVNVYLPILNWTDRDVAQFIKERKIRVHPLYYNNEIFDVKRRLGCLTCPLQSDKGKTDFIRYPKFVQQYIKHGLVWWNKPRDKKMGCQIKFESVYDLFAHNLFFSSYESFSIAKSGFFGKMNIKSELENYFKIDL